MKETVQIKVAKETHEALMKLKVETGVSLTRLIDFAVPMLMAKYGVKVEVEADGGEKL